MASAAVLMVFATFMSGLTGLLRDVAIGARFGREGADAFFNASSIPDLLYFLVAGGALRTGFVPVFTKYLAEGKEQQAWRTFSALFWLLAMGAALLAGVGVLAAEPLARLISPGWVGEHPEILKTCGAMMRIMFPAQVFFALGGLLMGTLNALKHFFWPAMGPIIYNCTIVAGAVLAPWLLGLPTLAYAVLLGAFIGNFLVQLGALRRQGGSSGPTSVGRASSPPSEGPGVPGGLEARPTGRGSGRKPTVFLAGWKPALRGGGDEGVRRVLILALPVMLGLAIAEINFVITKALATAADPEGGVSTLQYANHLWKFPPRMFGAGIAIALFPALSHDFARGEEDQYRRDFSFGMRNMLFLSLPATALMLGLAGPMVRFLWPGFDEAGVHAVTTTLLWFSVGIVPLGTVYVAARAFYARHDTVTPVIVGIISVAVCVIAAVLLDGPYKVAGLAMATALSGIVNAGLLIVLLEMRVNGSGEWRVASGKERNGRNGSSESRVASNGKGKAVGTPGRRPSLATRYSLLATVFSALRVLPPAVIFGAVLYAGGFYLSELLGTGSHWARGLTVLAPMVLGGIVFFAACKLMRVRELDSAWDLIARRFGRREGG